MQGWVGVLEKREEGGRRGCEIGGHLALDKLEIGFLAFGLARARTEDPLPQDIKATALWGGSLVSAGNIGRPFPRRPPAPPS